MKRTLALSLDDDLYLEIIRVVVDSLEVIFWPHHMVLLKFRKLNLLFSKHYFATIYVI